MAGQDSVLQVIIGQTLAAKSRACSAILYCNVEFALLFYVKEKLLRQKKLTWRCLLMTLKNSAKFGQKLSPAFQISPKKIGPFVSRRRIGSKFEILLLSFV